MIHSIQVYRALACIFVVLFHAQGLFEKYFTRPFIADFFHFGMSGVPIFFVISGFIMYYIHQHHFSNIKIIPSYIKKRLSRIYPVYWLVALISLPVFYLTGSERATNLIIVLKSFLLIPQNVSPFLGVAWTLTYEIFFYLIFATLIFNKWFGKLLITTWLLVCTFVMFKGHSLVFPYDFIFSPYNILFGMGILTAMINKSKNDKYPLFMILGVILFVTTAHFHNMYLPSHHSVSLMYGLSMCFILLASRTPEIEEMFEKRELLLKLGDASYSIYLIHYPVLSLIAKALTLFSPNIYGSIVFLITSGIAVFTGIIFHKTIEKPLMNWLTIK